MPNIREFNNPIDGLQPNDRAVSSAIFRARHTEQEFAYAGNQIGSSIAQVGAAYDKVKTQQDISAGLPQKSEIWNNLTTAQNVAMKNADPNDHSAHDKFIEEQVKPILDQWQTGFSTEESRLWARNQADNLLQHFTERGAAIASENAGATAVGNVKNYITNLSNTVMQDPSSLNTALGSLDRDIDGLLAADPNLSPQAVNTLRNEIRENGRKTLVESAGLGLARSNPDAAQAALTSGQYKDILSGTESQTLFNRIESIKHAQFADARAAREFQRQDQKDAAQEKMTALYAEGIGKGPNGSWAPPPGYAQRLLDIVQQHPQGVSMSEVHAAQNMVSTFTEDQASGRLVTSNPLIFNQFMSRLGTDPGQTGALTKTEIYQAAAARQLSNHDAQMLADATERVKNDPNERQLEKTLTAFFTSQKGFIQGTNGMPSAKSQERFYEFQQSIRNAISSARSRGMTAPEVEQQLLNPASKDYLGRSNSPWMKYYHTGQWQGDAAVSNIPGHPANAATAPATPGERPSLDDLAKANGIK